MSQKKIWPILCLCHKQKSDSLSDTKKVTLCLKQKSLEMLPTYYEGVSRARMLAGGQQSSEYR